MLATLKIRNFILIESLELELEPGFNVITGETGAGKSIIIGALGAVLGGRARSEMVRPGARQAEVEALFDVAGDERVLEQLAAADIPCDGELVVRRVIHEGGRSRAYLNGRLCTIGQLASLALDLADVTSQHESVALADPSRHLDYLDRYAALVDARAELAAVVDELSAVVDEIATLRDREKGRAEREDYLRYQLETIRRVAPESGELERLEAELGRLKHADRLSDITTRVAAGLDGAYAGEDDSAAGEAVGRLVGELQEAAGLDPQLEAAAEELEACWSRLRDLATEVARYAERLESDPARLDEVRDRIYQLERLSRQHGPGIDGVLAAESDLARELEQLEGLHSELPALEEHRDGLHARASKKARRLSKQRQHHAEILSEAVSTQLAELGMGQARVVVDVSAAPGDGELVVDGARLGRDGIDRVQFLIAPNAGMEPRPLGRIASGGELSRALLALKRALLRAGDGETRSGIQVLDEVDAGVGGETADRIGRAIADIARQRQVLCITHLAAIAAYGSAHFVVEKDENEAAATSSIQRVEGRARASELARMLTGARATRSSLAAARELLDSVARAA